MDKTLKNENMPRIFVAGNNFVYGKDFEGNTDERMNLPEGLAADTLNKRLEILSLFKTPLKGELQEIFWEMPWAGGNEEFQKRWTRMVEDGLKVFTNGSAYEIGTAELPDGTCCGLFCELMSECVFLATPDSQVLLPYPLATSVEELLEISTPVKPHEVANSYTFTTHDNDLDHGRITISAVKLNDEFPDNDLKFEWETSIETDKGGTGE